MAVTADEVQVVFSANYTQYSAAIDAVDAEFTKRLNHMGMEAARAGRATRVAFDEMTGSFDVFTPGAKKADDQIKQLTKTMNTNRMQAGNLAAQFNDIGVSLAGGMSPFLVALQQGTQINQVFGQIEGGVMPALRTAFLSLLNPISLATIGVISLGGYLVQWGIDALGAGEKVKTLDDIVRDHEGTLKAITEAYGRAAQARKDFTSADDAVLGTDIRTNLARAQAGVRESSSQFLDKFGISPESFSGFNRSDLGAFQSLVDGLKTSAADALPTMDAFRAKVEEVYQAAIADGGNAQNLRVLADVVTAIGQEFLRVPAEMEPFRASLLNLRKDLAEETPGAVDRFITEISRIGDTSPELRKLADSLINNSDELRKWSEIAVESARSIEYTSSATGQYNRALEDLSRAIDNVRSEKAQEELNKLAERAKDGEISTADLKKALADISGYAPDLTGAISSFLALFNQVEKTRAAVVGFTGQASTGGPARYQSDMLDLPSVGPVPEDKPSLLGMYENGTWKKGRSGGGSKKKSEYERETQQIVERTNALNAERVAQESVNPLLDDYGFAAARATAAVELLTAAQKSGKEVGREITDVNTLLSGQFDELTPKARAQAESILAMATNYGHATEASKMFKDRQDEIREAAEEALNTAKDVVGGMIDGFLEGEKAANVFAGALKKIGNALIDDVLNNIFKINSASSGGGSIFSKLFSWLGGGGGIGFTGANTTFGNYIKGIPGFAGGTNYAPGGMALVGEKGPEIVNLPRGSQVVPNHMIGGGGGTVIQYSPVMQFTGTAEELQEFRRAYARDRAEFDSRTVRAVKRAQQNRILR